MSSVVHDIDTMITYIKDNFNTEYTVEIYRNSPGNQKRIWMYRNSIEITEGDTQYSLLDMRGNADRENDTTFEVRVYSKESDSVARRNFDEFLSKLRDLAHLNTIGHYAFTQILNSKTHRTAFFTEISATILLTRRGKGHT